MRRIVSTICLAMVALSASPAYAEEEQSTAPALQGPEASPGFAQRNEAAALGRKASVLVRKKEYAEALDHFERAYGLAGNASAILGAAECERQLEHLPRSYDLFQQTKVAHADGLTRAQKRELEEGLTDTGARTGTLLVSASEEGATIEIDGRNVGLTPMNSPVRLMPAVVKFRVTKEGFEPFEGEMNVGAGEQAAVDAKLKPVPKREEPKEVRNTGVLDFCALAPKDNSERYQKQRLVLFNLRGQDIAQAKEEEHDQNGNKVREHDILAQVSAFDHAREVLLTAFPMQRFHNVITEKPAPESLAAAPSVTQQQMVEAVGDDRFAKYSIGCSDWVGMPRIVNRSAVWTKEKKTKDVNGQQVEYMAWVLDLAWSLEMDVYRKEGDDWTLAETIDAENGGLLGAALGLAAGALQSDAPAEDQPEHISKRPESSCQLPQGTSGSAALSIAACAGVSLDFDLGGAVAPGTGQARSRWCKDVDDDVKRGKEAMKDVAICTTRKKIEHVTLALQKAAKHLDGWKLYAPLQAVPYLSESACGVSLGTEEGAARGDAYIAVRIGPDGKEELGFGRIVRAGPGGEAGTEDPSLFAWRSGDADMGTRMEEHAQIGVILGVQPGVGLLLSKGDLESSTVFGGSIEGGYNASRFVDWGDEFWSKIYISYYLGSGEETFFATDLMPELVYYAGGGAAFFAGAGFSYVTASKQVDVAAQGGQEESKSASGATYGVAAETGFEYAFSPDWNARLTGFYRQNVSAAELKDEDETVTIDAGTLSGGRASMSLSYIF